MSNSKMAAGVSKQQGIPITPYSISTIQFGFTESSRDPMSALSTFLEENSFVVYFIRIFWIIIIFISTCLTAEQVWVSWIQYRSYALQLVEVNSRTNLMEFEFPAVTICSLVKVKIERVKDYVVRSLGRNISEEETEDYISTLLAISLLQFPHYNYASEYVGILNTTSLQTIQDEDLQNIMIEVGPQIEDMFQKCTWQGKSQKCEDIFYLQKTEEGFCYSFNSRTSESANETHFVPRKNYLSGRHTGLGVTFKDPSNTSGFRKFIKRFEGYNIILHNPNEIPDVTNAVQIKRSSDKINSIAVSPQKYIADETIQNLPPKVRACFWTEPTEEEESLHIPLRNGFCHARCRRDAIRRTCDCIPYFFHPIPGVKFCGIEHSKCLAEINVMLRNIDMYDLEDVAISDNASDDWSCRCVKFCSQVNYQAQFTSAPYHLLFSANEYAHLDVAYNRRWGQTFRKEVKFTFGSLSGNPKNLPRLVEWPDKNDSFCLRKEQLTCVAAVGGYASLLLGCSLISLLEMFYYFFRGLILFISVRFTNQNVVMKARTQSTKNIINYVEYPFLP